MHDNNPQPLINEQFKAPSDFVKAESTSNKVTLHINRNMLQLIN